MSTRIEGTLYQETQDLTLKEIVKLIREDLKNLFGKDYKFSLRTEYFSMGCAVRIALMKAPIDMLSNGTEYHSVNEYHTKTSDYLTEAGKKVAQSMIDIVNKYNMTDSDMMTDHYNTNFFSHFTIGKWDNPFINTLNSIK